MSALSSVDQIVRRFYRLVGSVPDDEQLTELGELTDDIAYEALTEGTWDAQITMLEMGYTGWRKRSGALTFSGSDEMDGGRYVDLPSDFLRAFGQDKGGRSALVEPSGRRWGAELTDEDDTVEGQGYYIKDEQLWLLRGASPPGTVYLDYHYAHPEWSPSVEIDFPLRCRSIIAPSAARVAADENWLPGAADMEAKIERAYFKARERVRRYVRQTKAPRRMKRPPRFATRY